MQDNTVSKEDASTVNEPHSTAPATAQDPILEDCGKDKSGISSSVKGDTKACGNESSVKASSKTALCSASSSSLYIPKVLVVVGLLVVFVGAWACFVRV